MRSCICCGKNFSHIQSLSRHLKENKTCSAYSIEMSKNNAPKNKTFWTPSKRATGVVESL